MTAHSDSTPRITWVAIDVAKQWNAVLVETPEGSRRRMRLANSASDHARFVSYLHAQGGVCRIAMEPTGMYHRPLAYRLKVEGFEVFLVSSLAAARYRDAMFNSWDKNDPKDAEIILELLKQGRTLYYHDPLLAGTHDLQELSKTYMHVALARTRLLHSLMTHYLPIYWPEFERYWLASRSEWLAEFLLRFPVPSIVAAMDRDEFIKEAWPLVGRKAAKQRWLEELHHLAQTTIGLPIEPNSLAVQTFRVQLERYRSLLALRDRLEQIAEETLGTNRDYQLLRSVPGLGPVLSLVVMAEAGDLRRFGHHRQFLKFCGLDLAKNQSGATRGLERLSKRGNARLRCAFWFAGRVATRMRENSFREKFERYVQANPLDKDLKRKAMTAVAAKIARVAYAVIKTETPYRPYFESAVPSGSIPLSGAVEAARTS